LQQKINSREVNHPPFKIANNALVDLPQAFNIHQKIQKCKSFMGFNDGIFIMTHI
jgi:hypothetical protein